MRILGLLILPGLLINGCPSSPERPPVQPILDAVLKAGVPPLLVPRALGGEYVALPAASVTLQLGSEYPGGPALMVVLVNERPVEFVSSDDIAARQRLDEEGYYSLDVSSAFYRISVTPPRPLRQGTSVRIALANKAANPPAGSPSFSDTLRVRLVTPGAKSIKEPSDVFFTDVDETVRGLGGTWYGTRKDSGSIIARNVVIAGWVCNVPDAHANENGVEDFIYDIVLDEAFLDRMYNDTTRSTALTGASLPGNPAVGPMGRRLDLRDSIAGMPGKRITLNSFSLLPPDLVGNPTWVNIHGEQNCWHIQSTQALLSRNWIGYGPPPDFWVRVPFLGFMDCWWPYNPADPDGRGPVNKGDYVVMKGTLFEDGDHLQADRAQWRDGGFEGHTGWIELHPIDWIIRPSSPPRRWTSIVTALAPMPSGGNIPPAETIVRRRLEPDLDVVPRPANSVLRYKRLVDYRFTDLASVFLDTLTAADDHLDVTVGVRRAQSAGRFKATYVLWWE